MNITDCRKGMIVRGINLGDKNYYPTDHWSRCKIVARYKDTVRVRTLGHEKSLYWDNRKGKCYTVSPEDLEIFKVKVRHRK